MISLKKIPITEVWKEIREKVLDFIRPTPAENAKIAGIVEDLTDTICGSEYRPSYVPITGIEPQGSTGIKQTHLRNAADIDLFIKLDFDKFGKRFVKGYTPSGKPKVDKESLSSVMDGLCRNWIMPALKKNGSYSDIILSYAEHPYVSAVKDGYEIDIVFGFELSPEYLAEHGPITAVDRTIHHSRFVVEHFDERMRDEVRLLKKFFKTHLCYGDKSPIGRGGFIGYSAELLIERFGDVPSVFSIFSGLPYNPVDYFGRTTDELRSNPRFGKDFIILIDPTDRNRNVAASISPRVWIYLTHKINEFSENPSERFFITDDIPPYDPEHYGNIDTPRFAFVKCTWKDEHYTKIRDKLYSIAGSFISIASREIDGSIRFPDTEYVIYPAIDENLYYAVFHTSKFTLDTYFERRGPPVSDRINASAFLERNPDAYIKEDGYYYVKWEREYTEFDVLLHDFMEQRSVAERLEGIPVLYVGKADRKIILEDEHLSKACGILLKAILPFSRRLSEIIEEVVPDNSPKSGGKRHKRRRKRLLKKHKKFIKDKK